MRSLSCTSKMWWARNRQLLNLRQPVCTIPTLKDGEGKWHTEAGDKAALLAEAFHKKNKLPEVEKNEFSQLRAPATVGKEVPTRRRIVGGASPGLSGNSGGNWPVSSPSWRQSFFSSSNLFFNLSSMADLRALSAATISSRAALAASLSSDSVGQFA